MLLFADSKTRAIEIDSHTSYIFFPIIEASICEDNTVDLGSCLQVITQAQTNMLL